MRTMKKHLKDAEEEQYRAEEDAAALRAELNSMQQHAINSSTLGGIASMRNPMSHVQAFEEELANLRSKLELESQLRLQEARKLVEEQGQVSALQSEKKKLKEKLDSQSKAATEDVPEKAQQNKLSNVEEDSGDPEVKKHKIQEKIKALQKERVEKLVQKLIDRLQQYVEGHIDEFVGWAKTEAANLSKVATQLFLLQILICILLTTPVI